MEQPVKCYLGEALSIQFSKSDVYLCDDLDPPGFRTRKIRNKTTQRVIKKLFTKWRIAEKTALERGKEAENLQKKMEEIERLLDTINE
jgi:hypothetical protein